MKTAASSQQKHIRVAGIVGMLAALAATLADISLQYAPTGQYGTQQDDIINLSYSLLAQTVLKSACR